MTGRKVTRKKKANTAPEPKAAASPYEEKETGPFNLEKNEDVVIQAINLTQDGMMRAFEAGKTRTSESESGKSRLGTYLAYIFFSSSYVAALIIIFCASKFEFPPEYQQTALGYMLSFPVSFAGIVIGKGKT
jgi:hypothetical protein